MPDATRPPVNTRFSTLASKARSARRQVKLAELIASVGKGAYVEPHKVTVAEFVRARVDQWEAAGDISARTAQRYRQLAENQIVPHLGAMLLQKLRPLDVETWHTTLRNGGRVRGEGGIAPRTIGHAHRILGKALRDAARNGMVSRNVVSEQSAPKVTDDEMVIAQDVPSLVERLRGWRLGTAAMVSLFTGLRLSEILALRWNRVERDRGARRARANQSAWHPFQAAEVQGRPARHHIAGHASSRGSTRPS
jgi:integrase